MIKSACIGTAFLLLVCASVNGAQWARSLTSYNVDGALPLFTEQELRECELTSHSSSSSSE